MAVLPELDRARVWRGIMRYVSSLNQEVSLTKAEVRAAIDATDNWIDSNQASFNAALPAAAQSGLTIGQKTLLFCAVAAMRVSEGLLKKIVGEVN